MGEIANAMCSKYEVKVICGPEIYDSGKKLDESNKFKLDESMELFRCKAPIINKNSRIQKLYRFILVSRNIYKEASRKIKSGDKVLMVTNPLPLILKMAKLRSKMDFELMLLVHDIFPENLIPARVLLPKFAYKVLENQFSKAYSKVDLMISLGRDMSQVLRKKVARYNSRPSIVIIENWGDIVNIMPQDKAGTHKKCTIQYAGNIGAVQGILQFISTFRKASNEYLNFSIWGTGSEEHRIRDMIENDGLKNVTLNGPYFRSQQVDILNECDLALVTLSKGMFGLGVPSKTYNILAAGKPILYIGEPGSEIGLLVKEHDLGWVFSPSDENRLIEFLQNITPEIQTELREKGKKARTLAVSSYSKEAILNKFLSL